MDLKEPMTVALLMGVANMPFIIACVAVLRSKRYRTWYVRDPNNLWIATAVGIAARALYATLICCHIYLAVVVLPEIYLFVALERLGVSLPDAGTWWANLLLVFLMFSIMEWLIALPFVTVYGALTKNRWFG